MKKILAVGLFALSLNCFSAVTLKENPKIKFTGYKFAEKMAVSGTFKSIEWNVPKSAKDFKTLMNKAKLKIDTHSIDAGAEARDINITEGLFKNWGGRYIEVEVKEVDEAHQIVKTELTIGKEDHDVYFDYYKNKQGEYVFTSSINLLQMGYAKAYNMLAEICGDLHTMDGIRKSWPTVDLEVVAKIQ